ncbi:MAG: oligosaccharide flippase family protein [Flavobacteriales bacterium]
MSVIKKLAGQTAIYGVSSMFARILNFLLTPLYVTSFSTAQYGEVSELYANVAFFMVLLGFGMETAFFRFSKTEENKDSVYSTALTFIATFSGLFILLGFLFTQPIANLIGYASRPDFIIYLALILGLDAFASIPMAKLRNENKAKKFAQINLINIGTNIFFNLLFIAYAKTSFDHGNKTALVELLYRPEIGIGYIFISNLLATGVKIILLYPEFIKVKWQMNMKLLKNMLIYSLPLMLGSFAGIINETFDRILLRRVLEPEYGVVFAKQQVGIYSGVYKLSILISLFIQAFRYAAEPFFFARAKEKNANETYRTVMNYFVLAVSVMFLFILMYLEVFKWLLPKKEYWEGLHVVPILLIANIFLGVYYNQSIWYKLSGQTKFGAYIAIGGAIVTIVLNVIFIPILGYVASAWTTLLVYGGMMLVSYYLGQKHYPIPYNLRRSGFFLLFAIALYGISVGFKIIFPDNILIILSFNTFLFSFYLWFIYKLEGIDIKSLLKNKE